MNTTLIPFGGKEKGMFTQCLDRSMAGGVAKAFLIGYFGGDVTVVLNEGRCTMEESETLYHFHVLRKPSQCGTIRLVSDHAFRCAKGL